MAAVTRADVHRPAEGRDRAPLPARARGGGTRRARRGDRVRATSTPASRARSRTFSGFVIVHRYAYVLLPVDGEPSIVFPSEARYVGEHGTTWIDEQEFVDRPGDWLAEKVRGKRVGVYGLDYVMTVRDSRSARRRVRARRLGRRVRPCAHGQVRARARVGARERAHQHRGLLGLPRGIRAGEDASARSSRRASSTSSRRAAAAGRWTWCSTGRTAPRCRSSRSPARARSRRPTACSRRSRSRAPAGTGSRSRARSAPASRATTRSGCSRRTRSTSRPRPARCVPARPPATPIAPSRRASSTAATTSAT